jgi:Transposase DDE domain
MDGTQLEDWGVIERMLPARWQAKAKESGALRRCREFADASTLLRVMLIHLVDGCSLRETAVRAREGGLVSVSDVALLKRLKHCQEWFRWMADELMRRWGTGLPLALRGESRRVRVVDGSVITEPGATGSTWRLHYSVSLPSLRCDEVQVSGPESGESFRRFTVRPGDLLIGDRGLAHRQGIRHVTDRGGDVIVRLNLTNVPLLDGAGRRLPLLHRLRQLRMASVGDWPAFIAGAQGRIAGRVCAIKKGRHASTRARCRAQRKGAREGYTVQPATLEAAGYIFVFTTLRADQCAPETVLEMYRGRWQVELAFKRLKSILAIGHLKKTDPEGAKAWLQGKLLVAFLIQALIAAGERFFPWGFPLLDRPPALPLAGDLPHAPPA